MLEAAKDRIFTGPAIGLVINLIGAAAVFRRGGRDLNLRAAYIHLLGDALGSPQQVRLGRIEEWADRLQSPLHGDPDL